MSEQISTIQTREVLELMRNLAPILNQKELFEFMLFSNRVLKRYMPEHYSDGLSEEVVEMRKDKAWLKEELLEELTQFNDNPNLRTVYETGIVDGIVTAINLTEKLDEPEVEENFYTFDNAKKWLQGNGFVVFEKDKLYSEVQQMISETYKAKKDQPAIPAFMADWIDTHNLYGSNPLREYRDLEIDFNEGWTTDEKDAGVYHWVNENPYAFIDALRYGYEVEKEPVYYAKIKGHELVETETVLDDDTGNDVSEFHRNIYFVLQRNGELVIDMKDSGLSGAKHFMTMNQWNSLGINETNADFEEVTE
ncbi:DUF1642 domain-containing protein [Jeotgalibaca porci]|uniref:DUF1642 domain-containing protein n=1 Tax=Jeotgalibaca porci TaxID=1868793 RepID=UPI00359F6975